MEEPVARVNRRRLLVALGVTVLVVPFLLIGEVWSGGGPDGPPASSTTTAPPSKGVTRAPTALVAEPLDASDLPVVDDDAETAAAVPTTPTTRVLRPPSTTTSTVEVDAGDDVEPPPAPPTTTEEGQASWSDLDPGTCLHRSIPFETIVRVVNISTGASTTCEVTGRGPYVSGRVIELERSVFAELAPTNSGVVTVRIEW